MAWLYFVRTSSSLCILSVEQFHFVCVGHTCVYLPACTHAHAHMHTRLHTVYAFTCVLEVRAVFHTHLTLLGWPDSWLPTPLGEG